MRSSTILSLGCFLLTLGVGWYIFTTFVIPVNIFVGILIIAGAGIIVDDLPDRTERSQWLAEELTELMADEKKLNEMAENCRLVAKTDAAAKIAEAILNFK